MKKTLLIATLAMVSAASQAATIFSDNFEGSATGSNLPPAGWSVVPGTGTVDTVGPGYWVQLCVGGRGTCVDLDGSTGNAGVLSQSFSLLAGVQYTASFELAGSQRPDRSDTVDVSFGTANSSYTLAWADAFSAHQLVFNPLVSGTYSLSFSNVGGDNVGALLDNVSVTAVPEPETYAMLLAGLGLLGAVKRRKAKAA